MATTVRNKTQKPLSIPLPRGKVLHLGPMKTGQISSDDVEHAGVKALVASGSIEIVGQGSGQNVGGGGDSKTRRSTQAHTSGTGSHRSGDR